MNNLVAADVGTLLTALREQAPSGNVDGARAGKVTLYPVASVEYLLRNADRIGWDPEPPPGLDGFHMTAITGDTRYRFMINPPVGEDNPR